MFMFFHNVALLRHLMSKTNRFTKKHYFLHRIVYASHFFLSNRSRMKSLISYPAAKIQHLLQLKKIEGHKLTKSEHRVSYLIQCESINMHCSTTLWLTTVSPWISIGRQDFERRTLHGVSWILETNSLLAIALCIVLLIMITWSRIFD